MSTQTHNLAAALPVAVAVDKSKPNHSANDLVVYLATPQGVKERHLLELAVAQRAKQHREWAEREAGLEAAKEQARALLDQADHQPELEQARAELARLQDQLSAIEAEGREHQHQQNRFHQLAAQAADNGGEPLEAALRSKAQSFARQRTQAEGRAAQLQARIATAQASLALLEEERRTALSAARAEGQRVLADAVGRVEAFFAGRQGAENHLLAAIHARLEQRRRAEFRRLLGLFGSQSSGDILRMAQAADLGRHYLEQLERMRRQRGGWVAVITPQARVYAARLAAGENEEISLPARAFAVILRADKVLVLDRQGWELQRVVFSPDGTDYPVGAQARRWKMGKRDVWLVAHPCA